MAPEPTGQVPVLTADQQILSTERVSVVVATRDRCAELCRTLDLLTALPERAPVVVVDNASRDGTAAAVHDGYPDAQLIHLRRNHGACARNLGVRRIQTSYVALSDDDSWWEPGALAKAATILDAHPRLGLIAARTLVGAESTPDPVNALMVASPLKSAGLPGPRVLGFLGCAAVIRKEAFLGVGGFSRLLFFGGEEQLLAYDLAVAGWAACYVPGVIAHHYPSSIRDPGTRRYQVARNRVLVAWLRRPAPRALTATAALALHAGREPGALHALMGLMARLPVALLLRRRLPPDVEAEVALLERRHS